MDRREKEQSKGRDARAGRERPEDRRVARQALGGHLNYARRGRRDKDEQSPRPGMKRRQMFSKREGEKKWQTSQPDPRVVQSTKSPESGIRVAAGPKEHNKTAAAFSYLCSNSRAIATSSLCGTRAQLGHIYAPQMDLPQDAIDDKLFKT